MRNNALIILAGGAVLAVGFGTGYLAARGPGKETAPAEARKSAAPGAHGGHNQLGNNAPEGASGGGADGKPAAPPPSTRPLGLGAREIMADLLRRAGEGNIIVNNRLALLVEAGEEGRLAMLEFLKQNRDVATDGKDEITEYNSLRKQVVDAVKTRTPEGEAAVQYLAENALNLDEALEATSTLDIWEAEIPASAKGHLASLVQQALNGSNTGDKRRSQLSLCGALARDLDDPGLLAQVEGSFVELCKDQDFARDNFAKLFLSLKGADQQAMMQRQGSGGDLAKGLVQYGDYIKLMDFRQPATLDALGEMAARGDVTTENLNKFLNNNEITSTHRVRARGDGMSWNTAKWPLYSEQDRAERLERIAGLEEVVAAFAASPKADALSHELAQKRLGELEAFRAETVKEPLSSKN